MCAATRNQYDQRGSIPHRLSLMPPSLLLTMFAPHSCLQNGSAIVSAQLVHHPLGLPLCKFEPASDLQQEGSVVSCEMQLALAPLSLPLYASHSRLQPHSAIQSPEHMYNKLGLLRRRFPANSYLQHTRCAVPLALQLTTPPLFLAWNAPHSCLQQDTAV